MGRVAGVERIGWGGWGCQGVEADCGRRAAGEGRLCVSRVDEVVRWGGGWGGRVDEVGWCGSKAACSRAGRGLVWAVGVVGRAR